MKRGSGVLAESGGSLVHSSFSMLNGGAVYGFAISPSCYWVRCVVRSVKPATYSYEYHTTSRFFPLTFHHTTAALDSLGFRCFFPLGQACIPTLSIVVYVSWHSGFYHS